MKAKPKKTEDIEEEKWRNKPETISKQKMRMDILLMQEESKDQNKSLLIKNDQDHLEKAKLLESDIRSQSFSLEKRLARRRFSQNKRVLKRSNSNSTKDQSSSIGVKDDSTSEEYSSILQSSKFEDSWNMENKLLLSNLNQMSCSLPQYNIS